MKELGFKITIDIGVTSTCFLDVKLDLANDTFLPYQKPNADTKYIDKYSNHPGHIKSSLSGMIERRINTLSKDKKIFDEAKSTFECALKRGKHNATLNYHESPSKPSRKRSRKRKCIFFNPPYCQSAKTNVGRQFLRLVDKHFTADHDLRKIFNRSTLKISYCCMPNMKQLIQGHNKRILSNDGPSNSQAKMCNCRLKTACPLNGTCLRENVIYKAEVSTAEDTKTYIGSTGLTFKRRYYGHTATFKDPSKRKATELANYIWYLKDQKQPFNIKWSIIDQAYKSRNKIQKVCMTCNLERLHLALADKRKTLNRRSEILGKCMHFRSLYF
jgi:hypothetical protein